MKISKKLCLMGVYAFVWVLIYSLLGFFLDIEMSFLTLYFLLIWIILNQLNIYEKIK